MALPKITHPVFKITIPSTKKAVSFRPYTVKEEKLLMMVKTSTEPGDVSETLKQVITNCCVESINVDKLAMFDIEYIFVKLRSKSVGEVVELTYTKDGSKIEFEVNLENVKVKIDPDHKKQFILTGNVGVNMNYPSLDDIVKLENIDEKTDVDQFMFDMFIRCIENVFDDNTVYKDFTLEELEKFVLDLPRETIPVIKKFFDTMPVLEHVVPVKFKNGTVEEVTLRGLKDFFIF